MGLVKNGLTVVNDVFLPILELVVLDITGITLVTDVYKTVHVVVLENFGMATDVKEEQGFVDQAMIGITVVNVVYLEMLFDHL